MGKHTLSQRSGRARALVQSIVAHHAARIARPSAPQFGDDDTQPITMATPFVRNGVLTMDPAAVDAELPWNAWLQNLPPVDGWTSTSSWEAQHGCAPKGGAR
ncbi:hypothetical protein ABZ412_34365 [Nocardia sp. NPDC005746]|uniref:hypothetical protein n=1 Tax=Nocardia sp. NPDC005746 TaxID=3157062 RepID=UPI0033FEBC18